MENNCHPCWRDTPVGKDCNRIVGHRIESARAKNLNLNLIKKYPLSAWKVNRAETMRKGRMKVRSVTVSLQDVQAFSTRCLVSIGLKYFLFDCYLACYMENLCNMSSMYNLNSILVLAFVISSSALLLATALISFTYHSILLKCALLVESSPLVQCDRKDLAATAEQLGPLLPSLA